MSENSNVKGVVESVKAVFDAVPIYQDLAQPATKQLGRSLELVAKSVHVALAPLSGLVWGYDQIKNYLENSLSEKLASTPPERIQTPAPEIAVPVIETLRYAGNNEELRNMFSNLLSKSMDKEQSQSAHPSFVGFIKNISNDEALILKFMSRKNDYYPALYLHAGKMGDENETITPWRHFNLIGVDSEVAHPEYSEVYIDNLIRIGLVYSNNLKDKREGSVERLLESDRFNKIKEYIIGEKGYDYVAYDRRIILLTDLGREFCRVCVIDSGISVDGFKPPSI